MTAPGGIAIAGAGAFGTALAIALAPRPVTLWARDAGTIAATRQSPRLPGAILPGSVTVTEDPQGLSGAACVLAAIPAQALRPFLAHHRAALDGQRIIACGKGIDLQTLTGATGTIAATLPAAMPAVLTGPGFAADLALGLPTALTLACADDAVGASLQQLLSAPALRLYRTTDTTGAELGGALKNVIAIACGACIGAGLGESARAALMTRGFAEMQRLAARLGAQPETLAGLSGFGDLVLTATSPRSRNYAFGLSLGRGSSFDTTATVEGIATARAVDALAARRGIDLPVTRTVAALCDGRQTIAGAMETLLNRPLKEE
jgi:glycerol-3-phosphate dehydrogenase (NAD(P)+)